MSNLFKQIDGYPGYEIGEDGEVISHVKYAEGKRRRTHVNRLGYEKVIIRSESGEFFTESVHRLVAKAFLPNPENLPEVDHIDGNRSNNLVNNLRWVTHRGNLLNARERIGSSWAEMAGKKLRKAVIAESVVTGEKTIWASARTWAIASGNYKRASNVCRAIQTGMPAYGMLWSFRDGRSSPIEGDSCLLGGVLHGPREVEHDSRSCDLGIETRAWSDVSSRPAT